MTWIDAAIIVVFLYFMVTAFQAGLVREIIGTTATLLGVVTAGLFYGDLRDSLLGSVDNDTTASAISFLILFLSITLAGQLVAMVVHPVITVLQLGIFDQLLGAFFGVVKAFIIVEVLLVVFVTFPRYDSNERIDNSDAATVMLKAADPVLKILPERFQRAHWDRQFNPSGPPAGPRISMRAGG